MNTTATLPSNFGVDAARTWITLLFILMFTAVRAQYGQNTWGLSVSATISGNGHGPAYTPGIYYRFNRTQIGIAALVNSNSKKVVGVQSSVQYILIGDTKKMPIRNCNEKLELFAFGTLAYRPSDKLSKSTLALEEKSESKEDPYAAMSITTIESYGGFGLKFKLFKGLQWSTSLGVGGYYSPNCPKDLYHNSSSVSLIARTGLYYHFL